MKWAIQHPLSKREHNEYGKQRQGTGGTGSASGFSSIRRDRTEQQGACSTGSAEINGHRCAGGCVGGQGGIGMRARTVTDFRYYCKRLMVRNPGLAERRVRSITSDDCRAYLQAAYGESPSQYRKARAIMSGVFSTAIKHDWCDSNPVSRVEVPDVVEKPLWIYNLRCTIYDLRNSRLTAKRTTPCGTTSRAAGCSGGGRCARRQGGARKPPILGDRMSAGTPSPRIMRRISATLRHCN